MKWLSVSNYYAKNIIDTELTLQEMFKNSMMILTYYSGSIVVYWVVWYEIFTNQNKW